MSWITFHTDKTWLNIKANSLTPLKHIHTDVIYSYEYDDSVPDFDYGNELENASEMYRFETGELLNLVLKVTVQALGEEGCDYLGQVFVPAHSFIQCLKDTAIEHDMVNEACLELYKNILAKYELLKNALE